MYYRSLIWILNHATNFIAYNQANKYTEYFWLYNINILQNSAINYIKKVIFMFEAILSTTWHDNPETEGIMFLIKDVFRPSILSVSHLYEEARKLSHLHIPMGIFPSSHGWLLSTWLETIVRNLIMKSFDNNKEADRRRDENNSSGRWGCKNITCSIYKPVMKWRIATTLCWIF